MRKIILLFMLLTCVCATCDIHNICGMNTDSNLTKLFVKNATDNQPITGATCKINIWWSNYTQITVNGTVIELGNGLYVYEISGNETQLEDVYPVVYYCESGSESSNIASSYEIISYTAFDYLDDINSTLINVNTTTTSNYNYLSTIYGCITNSTSILYENILDYLQGRLTTTIVESDKEDIAQ